MRAELRSPVPASGGGYSRGSGASGGASAASSFDQRPSAPDDYAQSAEISDDDIPF